MGTLRNRVQLIGHLGAEIELKTVKPGLFMCRFSLATNESFKNSQGEKITETNWHKLVAWGKPAVILVKYTGKGSEIAIQGKLINHSFIDREGNKQFVSEIQVNEVLLIGGKTSKN